jgi:site-specific recombinase XerD
MSAISPTVQGFFTERLINQKRVSQHTLAAYRDTFRLLFVFAAERSGKAPCDLDFEDLDAGVIGAFLDHLERERGNSARTRNSRLAAIHSMYRYAAFQHPEHAELLGRVMAIPTKRTDRYEVCFLEPDETKALLAAPERTRWVGRRDHALLLVGVQTGLRVSELTAANWGDVHLGRGPHIRCIGKGRKQRATPLTAETVAVLRVWGEEVGVEEQTPLFSTSRGGRLSTDAVALLVAKHAATARQHCLSLGEKTVTPHVLRHTCAMNLLRAGVEVAVIALWLGHEDIETTVRIYLHADMSIKERALARTTPPGTDPGRYRPSDRLLAFLEAL